MCSCGSSMGVLCAKGHCSFVTHVQWWVPIAAKVARHVGSTPNPAYPISMDVGQLGLLHRGITHQERQLGRSSPWLGAVPALPSHCPCLHMLLEDLFPLSAKSGTGGQCTICPLIDAHVLHLPQKLVLLSQLHWYFAILSKASDQVDSCAALCLL